MSFLRTTTSAMRTTAAASNAASSTNGVRMATVTGVRGYADKPDAGEFSEAYQRGNPSGFSKKEQAQEGQYVQRQEAEKLKALRESIAKQRQHLDEVEKSIDDLGKK